MAEKTGIYCRVVVALSCYNNWLLDNRLRPSRMGPGKIEWKKEKLSRGIFNWIQTTDLRTD